MSAGLAAARDGEVVELRPGLSPERLRVDRRVALTGPRPAVLEGEGAGAVQ